MDMESNEHTGKIVRALKHRTRLIEHELYATAHTADIIAEVLNATVFRFLSGPLGGDQQIGSRNRGVQYRRASLRMGALH